MTDLRDTICDALIYDTVDCGDVYAEIDRIFDAITKALEREKRFPRLSPLEIDLLFADARAVAYMALEHYAQIDWGDTASVVIRAVDKFFTTKQQRTKARPDNQADAGRPA
jgi:hypothetical protein